MEKLKVIQKINEPTDWVSFLVIVQKKNGALRICLDPRDLNKAVKREHFKLPTREEIMSQFAGAKWFSKLDASSGFWQMKLDDASSRLCTFNTPEGRYRFLRLPYGILSAPEVYHKTIHTTFEHIPGVTTMMDDVIVWGSTREERDTRLRQVLERTRSVNLKLNRDKCEFAVESLTFIGDVVSEKGVSPEPRKTSAIVNMERPQNKDEQAARMTSENTGITIEDAPATFNSFVWQHFGYPAEMINGKRVTDKTRTICKHCMKTMPYTAANTSTMQRHLQHHHSTVLKSTTAPVKKTSQTTLTNTFGPQLPQSSVRATAITRDIGVFIAADMRPFSVVENQGFRRLLHTLEPKYTIPSRTHFTRTVIPNLYEESKSKIVQILKDAASIAITTDGWTSRGTQSYITITAHTINSDWKMESVVLQTRPLFESHTGANIAEVLQTAVTDWELKKPNHGIATVIDNARNMDVAVREAGLKPHIKCFAHIINLATQTGLSVPRVARLLGRVRRVAAFFHRSSRATTVLISKQKQLNLPSHKLIIDVMTRWNSTLDMLARYLEQQAAITAALTSPELRQNAQSIDTLDSCDVRDAEDLVKLLHPLKTATTVLCEEKSPTVSLIVPLKSMIEQSMTPNGGDSTTVANTKTAILTNIANRYSGDAFNYLVECTVLDPRFRTLPQLDQDQCKAVFLRVQNKAEQLLQKQTTAEEITNGRFRGPPSGTPTRYYDPKRETRISADASQDGLGAVLQQLHEETWQPVAYASRALTSAEVNYAQIEKELLATTYACERFHQYGSVQKEVPPRSYEVQMEHGGSLRRNRVDLKPQMSKQTGVEQPDTSRKPDTTP
ncbi:hypothetical protein SRHO_G00031250 [Serrasalmus rhombeus]